MVLPSGTNKASGLTAALAELGLSPHNVVGVGDAENDHAFLSPCECGVAVANALPSAEGARGLRHGRGDRGDGVAELVDMHAGRRSASLAPRLGRHDLPLGRASKAAPVTVPAYGATVLVAGTSGSGKSTLATGLIERLAEKGYQFCVVDPEGDYAELRRRLSSSATPSTRPPPDEVLDVLAVPERNAVVNLLGVPLEQRPAFFDVAAAATARAAGAARRARTGSCSTRPTTFSPRSGRHRRRSRAAISAGCCWSPSIPSICPRVAPLHRRRGGAGEGAGGHAARARPGAGADRPRGRSGRAPGGRSVRVVAPHARRRAGSHAGDAAPRGAAPTRPQVRGRGPGPGPQLLLSRSGRASSTCVPRIFGSFSRSPTASTTRRGCSICAAGITRAGCGSSSRTTVSPRRSRPSRQGTVVTAAPPRRRRRCARRSKRAIPRLRDIVDSRAHGNGPARSSAG